MQNTKSISFIVACYNCANFIVSTLVDLIQHIPLSISEYEIICVDDCSTDNTLIVLQDFAKSYPQVNVFHHEHNLRQGGARNTGIKNAKGKYICFIDQDDTIPLYPLEEFISEMDSEKLDIMMCDAFFQQPDFTMLYTPGLTCSENNVLSGIDVFDKNYMIEGGMLGVWASIFRRDYILTLPIFAEKVRVEDADWMMRAIGKSSRLKYKPSAIYNWMYYANSQSHEMSAEMRADLVRRGLREIEVAQELKQYSENAFAYCYDDGIQSIKSATNALWKRYSYDYRYTFTKQFKNSERKKVQSLNVNCRCFLIFQFPKISLLLMSITSILFKLIRKK